MRGVAYVLSLFLACAMLFAVCGACAVHVPRPTFAPRIHAAELAVVVSAECSGTWTGSGVVLSPRRVLTAAHVVPCGKAASVALRTYDGRTVPARVEWYDDALDVAVLRPAAPLPGPYPAIAAPPDRRGVVCFAAGHPERRVSCGGVRSVRGLEIDHTARTVRGNSGSGVFDARGRLVGIVTGKLRVGGTATALVEEVLP